MSQEDFRRELLKHTEKDAEQFGAIHEVLKRLEEKLDPMAESYAAYMKMGKWGMAGLIAVSVIIGILVGLKNLFK